MNKRIKELCLKYAGQTGTSVLYNAEKFEEFAVLIVQECIEQAHSVAELRGANDDMIYGADTAALRISKHFRVKK